MEISTSVYQLLTCLDDTRSGVGLRADGLPDIEWVPIPAGNFFYQDGELIHLPTYYLARYPVTTLQFQVFIDAPDGFANPVWWNGLITCESHPDDQRWPIANHPREHVSWCAAVAFCRWLTAQTVLSRDLVPTPGAAIRLPTEYEWEKGARGTDARRYPWGSEFICGCANLKEKSHDLKQTSPVGLFPGGASPYGLLDMCGNVWEWCLNDFSDPENVDLSGCFERVLRGGAWNVEPERATVTYRDLDQPDYGYDAVGFRLCAST